MSERPWDAVESSCKVNPLSSTPAPQEEVTHTSTFREVGLHSPPEHLRGNMRGLRVQVQALNCPKTEIWCGCNPMPLDSLIRSVQSALLSHQLDLGVGALSFESSRGMGRGDRRAAVSWGAKG